MRYCSPVIFGSYVQFGTVHGVLMYCSETELACVHTLLGSKVDSSTFRPTLYIGYVTWD